MTVGVSVTSGFELLLVAFYGTSINTIPQKKMQNFFCSRIYGFEIGDLEHKPCWEGENVTHIFYVQRYNILKSQVVFIPFLIIEEI